MTIFIQFTYEYFHELREKINIFQIFAVLNKLFYKLFYCYSFTIIMDCLFAIFIISYGGTHMQTKKHGSFCNTCDNMPRSSARTTY